jgi:hypothetical protein
MEKMLMEDTRRQVKKLTLLCSCTIVLDKMCKL